MSISDKFSAFCSSLRMSYDTVSAVRSRYHGITNRLNKELAIRKKEEDEYVEECKKLVEKLKKIEIVIKTKSGEQDKVFGTVSSKRICDELKLKGIDIDKKKIIIDAPINSLGTHIVKVKLHKRVEGEVKVTLKK